MDQDSPSLRRVTLVKASSESLLMVVRPGWLCIIEPRSKIKIRVSADHDQLCRETIVMIQAIIFMSLSNEHKCFLGVIYFIQLTTKERQSIMSGFQFAKSARLTRVCRIGSTPFCFAIKAALTF